MAENKKELEVTLQVKELKYAIMNKAHVTARSLQAIGKLNYEAAAHMQASEDDESAYEIMRAINNAVDSVKVEFGEYLDESTTATDNLIDAEIENDSTIVLNLILPSNYNSSAGDSLGANIHDYIVEYGLYEWYKQTCPEIANTSKGDAMIALEKAKNALYKRSRPERPTYTQQQP